MSEAERASRLSYNNKRRKWLWLQAIIILIVAIAITASAVMYHQMYEVTYIDYTKAGAVNYRVKYKPNDYFGSEWQPQGNAYVPDLIDLVEAKFDYVLDINADDVDYEYTYRIDAETQLVDNATGKVIDNSVVTLKPDVQKYEKAGNPLKVSDSVSVSYQEYNTRVKDFLDTYSLTDVTANLVLKLHIKFKGECETFKAAEVDEYVMTLNVPLNEKTVSVEFTASEPNGEGSIVAKITEDNAELFEKLILVGIGVELFLLLIMLIYAYKTRNDDINYLIKVDRILTTYRSYIQQISNGIDRKGYQVLQVNTFEELLGIRDTIQRPILMSENEDQTCTSFIIPTDTNILYVYEVKVDNYDQIYAK